MYSKRKAKRIDGFESESTKEQIHKVIRVLALGKKEMTFSPSATPKMILWLGKVWCRCGGEISGVQLWTFSFQYQMRHLCGQVW